MTLGVAPLGGTAQRDGAGPFGRNFEGSVR